jgi:transcriptional regulator with XRE-family HTH domain
MLCRRIRTLREQHQKTQSDIAYKLGVSQAAYSRLEKGEVEISLLKLFALSEIYGVPIDKLLDGV